MYIWLSELKTDQNSEKVLLSNTFLTLDIWEFSLYANYKKIKSYLNWIGLKKLYRHAWTDKTLENPARQWKTIQDHKRHTRLCKAIQYQIPSSKPYKTTRFMTISDHTRP